MATPEEVQQYQNYVMEHGPAWTIDLVNGQTTSIRASHLSVQDGNLIATKRSSTPAAGHSEHPEAQVIGGWASGTWRSFHRVDND